jgi:S1-C subfamily serine protease
MTAAPAHDPLKHLSASLSNLVAASAPSIVSVHSHRALSSGFVWKPGLIVTADEALAEEGEVTVTLAGGKRVAATVAGRDPTTDVALLRAETGDVPAIALKGTPPAAGALAVAVGSQEGYPVAALGVAAVSGPAWTSMRGGEIDARIELDLSLRRRAEGGLALDADGQAFGMTVFGPRRLILVIPGATITRVALQLDARGKVARGYLGLGLQPVRLDRDGGIGAMVMSVDGDGPGARAGVHQGDIIVAWNGKPIGSVNAMLRSLGPSTVGTNVTLSLRRGSDIHLVDLVIGERL